MSSSGSPSRTPEKSFKMGPDRVALLTGTYKRPKPYPDAADHRRGNTSVSVSELNETMTHLPATRAILASMRTPPSPQQSYRFEGSALSSMGTDLNVSIKRAAIDWKLANKEAEVFKLKTDIQRLESDLRSRSEAEAKLKIQYEKELAKAEVEKQFSSSRVRSLELEVENVRNENCALRDRESELQTSFLPEKESLEKTIVELKVNDCDLRARLLMAEEEAKTVKLQQDHEKIRLNHEIKCLNLELDSVKTDHKLLQEKKQLLERELQQMTALREQVVQLQNDNESLKSSLRNLQETVELRSLFREDMDELKRLREENAILKEKAFDVPEREEEQLSVHSPPMVYDEEEDVYQAQDLMSEDEDEDEDEEEVNQNDEQSSLSSSSESEPIVARGVIGDDVDVDEDEEVQVDHGLEDEADASDVAEEEEGIDVHYEGEEEEVEYAVENVDDDDDGNDDDIDEDDDEVGDEDEDIDDDDSDIVEIS